MDHEKSSLNHKMIGAIEVLNDMGFNIVYIDDFFYIFTTFEPADDTVQYTSLVGKDVTEFVETSLEITGLTEQRKIELHQKLSAQKDRRREYSSHVRWVKYLANL